MHEYIKLMYCLNIINAFLFPMHARDTYTMPKKWLNRLKNQINPLTQTKPDQKSQR